MTFDHKLAAKQEEAVEYMLRPESDGAALLAWDVGFGKTRTGLMLARARGVRCVLIVVPLQTMDDWATAADTEYPGVPVHQIDSSVPGKSALAAFQWRTDGIYLITHQYWEILAWKEALVKKRRKDEPDRFRKVDSGVWAGGDFTFIYDESHRSANIQNWTFKALMNLTPWQEGGAFKLAMSGTFAGDRFDGAYGAAKWLWPHRTDILPNSIFDWRKIWADTVYDKWAPRNEKVVGERDEGAFVSALPCYLRMESEEPPAIEHTVWLDLYDEQRRVYDELDDKMVAWILDNPLVAEYSITKRARQRQTTLAMPTLTFSDEGELLEVTFDDDAQSAKTDALIREIDGGGELDQLLVGEPLLILTDSQKYAKLLTQRLNREYGDVAREWSGKVTKANRKKVKADFIEGRIDYIVGVQSAMGTGTNGLQHRTHIVVMMSLADRRIDNEQGIGRARRKGQTKQVHAVYFLAKNTVDLGQASAQVLAAQKMARSMRANHRREQREELLRRNQ